MQNRRAVVDRLAAMAEKQVYRQALKDGVSKEEAAKDRSSVLPNRQGMRHKGIGVTQKYGRPFGRLTGYRLTPASFYTMIAIHQPQFSIYSQEPIGVRKMVVPRDRFENKDV